MRIHALLAAGTIVTTLGAPGAATAQDATPAAPCPVMSDAETATMAGDFMSRLNAGDLDGIAQMVAPDGFFSSAIMGPKVGPEEFAGVIGSILAAYPDATHETKDVVADNGTAIIRWTASGTNDGSLNGRDPSGESREWEGFFLLRGECGKIVEAQSAVEQAAVLGLPGADANQIDAPAAGEVAATPGDCDAMSEDAMRAAVDEFWNNAWNAHDPEAYLSMVTSDLVQHWTSGDDTQGADASAERLKTFFAAMPDLEMNWTDIAAEGDLAAAAWTLKGTDSGGLFGNPPTGAAIEYDGINMFRFRCGKIAEVWSEGNIQRLQQQLAGS